MKKILLVLLTSITVFSCTKETTLPQPEEKIIYLPSPTDSVPCDTIPVDTIPTDTVPQDTVEVITTKLVRFNFRCNGMNLSFNNSSSGVVNYLYTINPQDMIFEYYLDENEYFSFNATMMYLYGSGGSPYMMMDIYIDNQYYGWDYIPNIEMNYNFVNNFNVNN